jgi:hypothetical protein
MIEFDVKSNIKEFNRKLLAFEKKQLPFAASKAINETLKEGRVALVSHLKSKQKKKSAWWNNKATGINIKYSNKKNLLGVIFTKIWWGKLQEYGGIKTPKGEHILIPTARTPKYARKAGGHVKLFNDPKILRHRGDPIIKLKSGKEGVFKRRGKKRYPIDMVYSAPKKANIDKPILNFKKIMHKVFNRRFRKNFIKNLNHALKTAK